MANLEFDVKKELKLNADEVNKWGKTFSFFASCQDIASGESIILLLIINTDLHVCRQVC